MFRRTVAVVIILGLLAPPIGAQAPASPPEKFDRRFGTSAASIPDDLRQRMAKQAEAYTKGMEVAEARSWKRTGRMMWDEARRKGGIVPAQHTEGWEDTGHLVIDEWSDGDPSTIESVFTVESYGTGEVVTYVYQWVPTGDTDGYVSWIDMPYYDGGWAYPRPQPPYTPEINFELERPEPQIFNANLKIIPAQGGDMCKYHYGCARLRARIQAMLGCGAEKIRRWHVDMAWTSSTALGSCTFWNLLGFASYAGCVSRGVIWGTVFNAVRETFSEC